MSSQMSTAAANACNANVCPHWAALNDLLLCKLHAVCALQYRQTYVSAEQSAVWPCTTNMARQSSSGYIQNICSLLYGTACSEKACETHQFCAGRHALWLLAVFLGLPGSHALLGLQSGLQQTALGLQGNALGLQGNALGLQLMAHLSGVD